MIKKEILNTVEKYNLIKNNQHIIIGLSGGPDSMCLFHGLLKLRDSNDNYNGITLYAVHVDHKMRPDVSAIEAKHVAKYCESLGVRCIIETVDCLQISKAEKISSEEAGRNARYRAFNKFANELVKEGIHKDDIKIAVAQNADDRAETTLFRIIRGTGIHGLSSISYSRYDEDGFEIIRPLMNCYKNEILNYCKENILNPIMDETNKQPIYTRNKIRLNLIPYLEEYNPTIKKSLNRLSDIASEEDDYMIISARRTLESMLVRVENLLDYTEKKYGKNNSIIIELDEIKKCHPAIRKRIYFEVISKISGCEDFSSKHILDIDNLIFSNSPSIEIQLPNYIVVRKIYDKLGFFHISDMNLQADILIESNKIKEIISFDADKLSEYVNIEILKESPNIAKVRRRESGDYIVIESGHKKKIKKLLIDEKIPKYQRGSLELFVIGNLVVKIVFPNGKIRWSKYILKNEETKKSIDVEFRYQS